MIDLNPIAQATHHRYQCFQIARFEKVGIRSQIERALHVFAAHRGGQDYNRQAFERTRLGSALEMAHKLKTKS